MEPTCPHFSKRYTEDQEIHVSYVCLDCGQSLPLPDYALDPADVVLASVTTDSELLNPVED